MSDHDTTCGFDSEWLDDAPTITVNPDVHDRVDLRIAAFRWAYEVDFIEVAELRAGPRNGVITYVITGRDAEDFVIRWNEES